MVGLCVDVLWVVVWLSVRAVGTVCEIEGDVQVVDGAEVCELVGLFILNDLCNEYGKDNIGLYRNDGLAIFKHRSGPQAERIRRDITRRFKTHGLNITIQTNMKTT